MIRNITNALPQPSMENIKLAIKRAQKQDQKAFHQLFNYYWDYLYKFQLKKTGNPQLAEEISIRTFTKAFDRIDTFNDQFEFKTWLLTISKNLYSDLLRKENKKSAVKPTDLCDTFENQLTESNPSPEEILIINEKLESLLNKIKSLHEDYRQILQLRFFEGSSYKEISHKMDQPINTIKVKLLRAKNLLAQKIEQDVEKD